MKEYGLILDGAFQAGKFEIIAKTNDTQEYLIFNLEILNQYFSLVDKKSNRKLHVVVALCENDDPASQIFKVEKDYKFCYIEALDSCWVNNRHTLIGKARLVPCE